MIDARWCEIRADFKNKGYVDEFQIDASPITMVLAAS
jgi:hypothetical protein